MGALAVAVVVGVAVIATDRNSHPHLKDWEEGMTKETADGQHLQDWEEEYAEDMAKEAADRQAIGQETAAEEIEDQGAYLEETNKEQDEKRQVYGQKASLPLSSPSSQNQTSNTKLGKEEFNWHKEEYTEETEDKEALMEALVEYRKEETKVKVTEDKEAGVGDATQEQDEKRHVSQEADSEQEGYTMKMVADEIHVIAMKKEQDAKDMEDKETYVKEAYLEETTQEQDEERHVDQDADPDEVGYTAMKKEQDAKDMEDKHTYVEEEYTEETEDKEALM